jgi:hypothetical protein
LRRRADRDAVRARLVVAGTLPAAASNAAPVSSGCGCGAVDMVRTPLSLERERFMSGAVRDPHR